MSEQDSVEIEHIKAGLEKNETRLERIEGKLDIFLGKINELEKYRAVNENQARSCVDNNKREFDAVWGRIRDIESKGKNNIQMWAWVMAILTGAGGLVMGLINTLRK